MNGPIKGAFFQEFSVIFAPPSAAPAPPPPPPRAEDAFHYNNSGLHYTRRGSLINVHENTSLRSLLHHYIDKMAKASPLDIPV